MSEHQSCFMCDPSILEQGQRCATGAPICDRHRDQLTGNMRPPTAAELALTARAEAAEQQAARLRAALRDFESNGIRADCNPTVPLEGRDTAWWYAYIANADLRVRERARAALAASQPVPADEAQP